MTQTARRPSVQEIEQLREQLRRDPRSPAFIQLGEAYLALNRPGDAIEVANQGLQGNPDSVPGRMVLGRAHAMLHQWKEAQTELLRVVKIDRNHAAGFLLLGEVLLRRVDFERALPVLQHAQNLDAHAPGLDDMLRRARSGMALDPPPPIPAPLNPVSDGASGPGPAPAQAASPFSGFSDEPTHIAPNLLGGGMPAGGGMMPPQPGYPQAGPGASIPAPPQPGYPQAGPGASIPAPPQPGYPQAGPGASIPAPPQPVYPQAGPGASFPAPPPQAPPPQAPPPQAPPPAAAVAPPPAGMSPAVRPRIMPMEKPRDAAKQSMRDAAAVGDYLNTLLTRGLLQVPDVQVRLDDLGGTRSKRWGRSIMRTFVFLFFLLAVGLGGGGYWYYQAEQTRKADVERLLAQVQERLQTARYADLQEAVESTRKAMERDKRSSRAIASFARAASLSALLYGTPNDQVEMALTAARQGIAEGEPGWEDIVFAQAALTLSRLHQLDEATSQLEDTRNTIAAWVESHPDDHWMRWLQGRALLAAGNLSGAATAFEAAEAGGKGPVVATISRADMLLDAGKLTEAEATYEAALKRAENHALALVSQAMLDVEYSAEPADIKGDLSIRLAEEAGPRVAAYKALALALVHYMIEDYDQVRDNLAKATDLPEPRFQARVALLQLMLGKIQEAGETRAGIVWHSKAPEPDPLVTLVDAELLWSSGLPAQTVEKLGERSNPLARLARARALFDLGKVEEARSELDELLTVAPNDWEALVWHAAASLVTGNRKQRDEAEKALAELGRKHKSKVVRYAHGAAYLRMGRDSDARSRLEQSLEDVSDARPHSLAYRSHTALAELDIAAQRLPAALEHVEQALAQNPGYLPAVGVKGRIELLQGQAGDALASLAQVVEEPEAASAATELAFAEAVATRGKADEKMRKAAREAVLRARDKGAPAEELARVAALVDEGLAAELGAAPPDKKDDRRRRRRR